MQIQAINNLNSMANIQKVSNNSSNMNFGCAIAKDCFCPSCAKEAQAKPPRHENVLHSQRHRGIHPHY